MITFRYLNVCSVNRKICNNEQTEIKLILKVEFTYWKKQSK